MNIIAEVGGLGSGKTLNGSKRAIKLEKKQLKKWALEKKGQPAPILYSNIPLTYKYKNKRYNSIELTLDHLLMKAKIPQGSVIFIDEFGTLANQFDWNKKEVKNELTEFIRLYRHYTQGGYLVLTDQAIDNIVKPVRDRINAVIYNTKTTTLGKLYCNQCVVMRYTSQLDSYTAQTMNDLIQRRYGFINRQYDTFTYSEIYNSRIFKELKEYQSDNLKARQVLSFDIKTKNTNDLGKGETL